MESTVVVSDFSQDDLMAARILLESRTVVQEIRSCPGRAGDTVFAVNVGVEGREQRWLKRQLGW